MPYITNLIKTFPLWKHNHTTLMMEHVIERQMEEFATLKLWEKFRGETHSDCRRWDWRHNDRQQYRFKALS